MTSHRTETPGEILEDIQADVNVPWMYQWTKISHYYGDSVRAFLISGAILMLITAPFYTDSQAELPFIVLGAVVMVAVAALTSPRKRGTISADVLIAGSGFVIYQTWALSKYDSDPMYQFVLREAISILFLFALYFSTKTLRSMLLDQIGHPDEPGEFLGRKPASRTEEERLNWKQQAKEALEELNEHEKVDFND